MTCGRPNAFSAQWNCLLVGKNVGRWRRFGRDGGAGVGLERVRRPRRDRGARRWCRRRDLGAVVLVPGELIGLGSRRRRGRRPRRCRARRPSSCPPRRCGVHRETVVHKGDRRRRLRAWSTPSPVFSPPDHLVALDGRADDVQVPVAVDVEQLDGQHGSPLRVVRRDRSTRAVAGPPSFSYT